MIKKWLIRGDTHGAVRWIKHIPDIDEYKPDAVIFNSGGLVPEDELFSYKRSIDQIKFINENKTNYLT